MFLCGLQGYSYLYYFSTEETVREERIIVLEPTVTPIYDRIWLVRVEADDVQVTYTNRLLACSFLFANFSLS